MAVRFAASLVALALVLQACSSKQAETTPEPSTQGGIGSENANPGGPTDQPTVAQIELGKKIFHGQVANGTCAGCHGANGKGTGVAPNLADAEWLTGDGSMEGIVSVVTTGVPTPKKHDAAMPPKGGSTNMTDDQVRAVSAYVYSLSHPTK